MKLVRAVLVWGSHLPGAPNPGWQEQLLALCLECPLQHAPHQWPLLVEDIQPCQEVCDIIKDRLLLESIFVSQLQPVRAPIIIRHSHRDA